MCAACKEESAQLSRFTRKAAPQAGCQLYSERRCLLQNLKQPCPSAPRLRGNKNRQQNPHIGHCQHRLPIEAMQAVAGCPAARHAVRHACGARPVTCARPCGLRRRATRAAWSRAAAPPRRLLARALTEETELTEVPEPEDARGAIALGLKLYNAEKHQAALDLFAKALELPGTGLKRFRCDFLCRTFLQASSYRHRHE